MYFPPVCRSPARAGACRIMVTNQKFGEFVGNTSYRTDSEKYGWSFVFLPMLSERQQREIQQVLRDREKVLCVGAAFGCPYSR